MDVREKLMYLLLGTMINAPVIALIIAFIAFSIENISSILFTNLLHNDKKRPETSDPMIIPIIIAEHHRRLK